MTRFICKNGNMSAYGAKRTMKLLRGGEIMPSKPQSAAFNCDHHRMVRTLHDKWSPQ